MYYPAVALDRPGTTFKIFQFPADKIPRIDGRTDDWAIVPDSYVVVDQLRDDAAPSTRRPTKDLLDVRVRVGWVKGLNRLYFLYEAYGQFIGASRVPTWSTTLSKSWSTATFRAGL